MVAGEQVGQLLTEGLGEGAPLEAEAAQAWVVRAQPMEDGAVPEVVEVLRLYEHDRRRRGRHAHDGVVTLIVTLPSGGRGGGGGGGGGGGFG